MSFDKATDIKIALPDKREFKGKVVGSDQKPMSQWSKSRLPGCLLWRSAIPTSCRWATAGREELQTMHTKSGEVLAAFRYIEGRAITGLLNDRDVVPVFALEGSQTDGMAVFQTFWHFKLAQN